MLRLFLIIISAVSYSDTAKILAVYPIPSISHQVVFHALTRELIKRGHEVVVITTDPDFPEGQTPANLTEINVHDVSYNYYHNLLKSLRSENKVVYGVKSNGFLLRNILVRFFSVIERQIKTEEIQKLIQSNKKFDLLLIEAYIRPALIYSHIFKAPVILVSSAGAALENLEMIGAPTHSILYPTFIRSRLHNLSIWERIQEFCNDMTEIYTRNKQELEENEMLQRILGPNTPTINELRENVDMLFLNFHPMWMNNMPVPPGIVFMGGLPQKLKKEIPQDLKSYLDSSKNGVVYVSFGTNVFPSSFPSDRLKVLVESLSELPYDILFKWNDDELPGRTDNIKISKWLPQSDLLKHPKVKAFLTQGGLQSTDEAITAGVPLVCIPMIGDQWYNSEKYEHFKIGIQLDLFTFTKSQLKNAIESIVQNTSYRENIVKLREQMNDQPQTPLERAAWWVEYVIRHGGAKHLRAPAANMSWVEYYELKLVFVLLTALLFVLVVIARVVTFLWSIVARFTSKSSKVKRS